MIITSTPPVQENLPDCSAFCRYRKAGLQLIPLKMWNAKSEWKGKVREDGKRPRHKNWTTREYKNESVLAEAAESGRNIGVRLRESELVLDVDPRHDGLLGLELLTAELGIDLTQYPKVITGSGGFHFYMAKPGDVPVIDTIHGYPGVEFKSKGRQVVGAGSKHPNGTLYKWDEAHPAIEKGLPEAPANLIRLITRPQRSAGTGAGRGDYSQQQLARALDALDPEEWNSNDKWLRFMMACHHATNGEGRSEFIDWSTRDPAYSDHAEVIGRRWDSLSANKAGGVTVATLNKILADKDLAHLQATPDVRHEFEGIDEEAEELEAEGDFEGSFDDGFSGAIASTSMAFDMANLPLMLDHAESAMLAAGAPLYQQGGRAVHPVRTDHASTADDDVKRADGSLVIRDVNNLRMREYIIEHAPFHKAVKNKALRCAVPLSLASHYLARSDKWRLPTLNGVIEAPTLRRDGTLLIRPGYDEQSGLLFDPNGIKFPPINDEPSKVEARAALDLLIDVFKGFPFVRTVIGRDNKGNDIIGSPSRSVQLSAALTALVRRTLHAAPAHATTAPAAGTGKTLAQDVVSIIATGRAVPVMNQGATQEEDEKRYFTVLLDGDQVALIDNITRPVEGDALCSMLTQATYSGRILGESRKVSVPTNVLWLLTGNNLRFKGDMTTRSLVCFMDAGMENPETRRFEGNLKEEVAARRTELVTAGLTVLRGFVVAGRPGLEKLEPFGRFEAWNNLVRGALVWLGEADPCLTRALIAADDDERMTLMRVLHTIHAVAPAKWITVREIERHCVVDNRQAEELRDALDDIGGDSKRIGKYLASKEGRIADGLRLMAEHNKHKKVRTYKVVPV